MCKEIDKLRRDRSELLAVIIALVEQDDALGEDRRSARTTICAHAQRLLSIEDELVARCRNAAVAEAPHVPSADGRREPMIAYL